MPVGPTPLCNRRQRAGVTALGRYLPHHILACPRLAPRTGGLVTFVERRTDDGAAVGQCGQKA
jgi:hypothetical protein